MLVPRCSVPCAASKVLASQKYVRRPPCSAPPSICGCTDQRGPAHTTGVSPNRRPVRMEVKARHRPDRPPRRKSVCCRPVQQEKGKHPRRPTSPVPVSRQASPQTPVASLCITSARNPSDVTGGPEEWGVAGEAAGDAPGPTGVAPPSTCKTSAGSASRSLSFAPERPTPVDAIASK